MDGSVIPPQTEREKLIARVVWLCADLNAEQLGAVLRAIETTQAVGRAQRARSELPTLTEEPT